uniref:Uncharacterized protein n=1 Tax=Anguilla anguilla TaxID=7936 RepID=A0A0E9UIC5_ANGAN
MNVLGTLFPCLTY